MKRLFALGCSFTSYAWPSYADFAGLYFDEYENWAFPGLGNRALLERLSEIHATKNLTKQDTVIIQWTNPFRNDTHKFSEGHWRTKGSIFNFINSDRYNRKWLDEFFDEKSFCYHTLNNIHIAIHMLESIGCKWYFTSMGEINKAGSDYRKDDVRDHGEDIYTGEDLWEDKDLKVYKDKIYTPFKDHWLTPVGLYAWKSKHDCYTFFNNQYPKGNTANWFIGSKKDSYKDTHPSILQHKEYLDNIIIPALGLDSQNEPAQINKWIDTVQELYTKCGRSFKSFTKSIDDDHRMKNWYIKYRGM